MGEGREGGREEFELLVDWLIGACGKPTPAFENFPAGQAEQVGRHIHSCKCTVQRDKHTVQQGNQIYSLS